MISRKNKFVYEKQAEVAEVLKSMAHPLRIAILDFLRDQEKCVCDIAEHVGSERSNVSRHLSIMAKADILTFRKEGLKVFYQLKAPCVLDFLSCVNNCLKEQAKETKDLLRIL
ncbi:MAG: ArsR/SmtB family transcription factor [Planctomycetota bacterium]|jgi:ArsR family transcriptional regulator